MIDDGCGPGEPPPDECGVCGGPGMILCVDGSFACDEADCETERRFTDDGEEYGVCADGFGWNSFLQKCEWEGTSGAQWGSSHCARPENSCLPGECCCDNGMCHENCCDDGGGGGGGGGGWTPDMYDPTGTTGKGGGGPVGGA